MKKMFAVVAIVSSLFLIAPEPAVARGGGGGGHGGGQGGGHGVHGGGFHGGGGFRHGFHGHGRVVWRGGVVVGVGPYWGPYWGYPYGGYPYGYAYPYYPPEAYPMPMVSEPQSYIQQSVPTNYWYYCEGAHAYYPYVQQCPGGWLTVVPQTAPTPEPPK